MKVEDIKFQSAQHVLDEIYNMNVKGGSPFGRAAAWAYKLACEQEALDSFDALEARMQELSDKLHKLKPTMATIAKTMPPAIIIMVGFLDWPSPEVA